jgi:hypothetical protein
MDNPYFRYEKSMKKNKNPLTKKIQLLEESETMNPYAKIHTLGIASNFTICFLKKIDSTQKESLRLKIVQGK